MTLYGKNISPLSIEGVISAPREKRTGLNWPSKNDPSSPYFGKNSGFQLIRDQVKQFVLTTKGERVMLPDFGTTLINFVFEPFNDTLASILAQEINEGIRKYIPNITVNAIRFFQNDNLHGFGMPGIQVQVAVSPQKSNSVINIQVTV
tara:strand:- start:25645 stop:26088 length:444 start_codon:yes stop_codon:yes gene_type:complete